MKSQERIRNCNPSINRRTFLISTCLLIVPSIASQHGSGAANALAQNAYTIKYDMGVYGQGTYGGNSLTGSNSGQEPQKITTRVFLPLIVKEEN